MSSSRFFFIRTLTSHIISSKPHHMWTSTDAFLRRVNKTQVGATAIVHATRVGLGGGLTTGVYHFNVERLSEGPLDYCDVATYTQKITNSIT